MQHGVFAIDGNDWARYTGHKVKATVARHTSRVQEIEILDLERFGLSLWMRELAQREGTAWPQFAERDEHWYHQPLVLPALFYHPHPADVLILGGGDYLAAWRVLMRRGVKRVKIADWDKMVAELVLMNIPWIRALGIHTDDRVDFREEIDVAGYLPATEERFDVIIGDLVDAPTLQKFMPDIHEHIFRMLNPGGVFATQAGPLSLVAHDLTLLAKSVAPFRKRFRSIWVAGQFIESFAYCQAFLYAWKDRDIQPYVPRRRELDARFIAGAVAQDRPFYNPATHRKIFTLEPEIKAMLGLS